ncbi:MAG TPA: biosynthetic peptidoglycan transglycosylase [Candidatus Wallbacteria bacterium]|nr:biosynthetic peptidoglycan transglycosylase [Candidatus Wallbacteria bacterium]
MIETTKPQFMVNMFYKLVAAAIVMSIIGGVFLLYIIKLSTELPETDSVKKMISERSVPIEFHEIPDFLVKSVVAAYDPQFFNHKGLDPARLKNYAINKYNGSRIFEDAPTITQMVSKMALMAEESYCGPSFIEKTSMKIKELMLALKLEFKIKNKNKIFEIYMNNAYFGNNVYGLLEAASVYFNKRPSQLLPAECAVLTAMMKRPESRNPYRHPVEVKAAQRAVLESMAGGGFISEKESENLKAEKIRLQPFVGSSASDIAKSFIEL